MGLTVLSVAYPLAPVQPDATGGAEQVLWMLDRAVVERGWRSIVIAQAGSTVAGALVPIPAPLGLIGETERHRAWRTVALEIARTVESHHPDVIHLHGLDFAQYWPPAGPAALITLHLPLAWHSPPDLRPLRPNTWFNAVSGAQGRGLAHLPTLAAVIENGVELPPPRAHAKRSFALGLGRICAEKGWHDALDAARLADLPLILAGEVFPYPEHRAYFEREIVPRLDGKRRWIGAIRGPRKRRMLAAARCLVAPSKVPETAGLAAREALAAGTPVVTYGAGALAETVRHGKTGFVVKDVEEMAQAMRMAAGLDPQACRQDARERFSAGRMTRAYLDLYERLAGGSKPVENNSARLEQQIG